MSATRTTRAPSTTNAVAMGCSCRPKARRCCCCRRWRSTSGPPRGDWTCSRARYDAARSRRARSTVDCGRLRGGQRSQLQADSRGSFLLLRDVARQRIGGAVVADQIGAESDRHTGEIACGELAEEIVVGRVRQRILSANCQFSRIEIGVGQLQAAGTGGIERLAETLACLGEAREKEALCCRGRYREPERSKRTDLRHDAVHGAKDAREAVRLRVVCAELLVVVP